VSTSSAYGDKKTNVFKEVLMIVARPLGSYLDGAGGRRLLPINAGFLDRHDAPFGPDRLGTTGAAERTSGLGWGSAGAVR
jgi:hypothetical protein